MRKRYLFFDIDGTLIAGGFYGNNYIPESTREAIRKLMEAGHFLSLATGRSEAMSRAYMEECGIRNMVSDGGWIRVAMGNASDELKSKADLITTDVDKDGIWNACVELGLF